jgi:hypothetical protein
VSTTVLEESAGLLDAAQSEPKGIWRTRIIEADVQGSSGFYPAEVLRRDGPTAFPAGTHVYLDHPTNDEEEDRPERSVRDLAGYLVEAASFEESMDGRGLFARVQFIPEIRERIKALAPVIGLSIRAAGEVVREDGRNVIRSITQGLSVDVVTRAGAGGRLVTMTESTQPESPPANQGASGAPIVTPTVQESAITTSPNNTALRSEVVAMREALTDRLDQAAVDTGRLNQTIKESQKLLKQLMEENTAMREKIDSIDSRQAAVDSKLGESKKIGDVVGELIKAQLPMPSLVRLAESYRSGQDLHAAITAEREYLKKVLRENERSDINRSENTGTGLGLMESAMTMDLNAGGSDDFSKIEDVLSGKAW